MILGRKYLGNRTCDDYTMCEECPLHDLPSCASENGARDTLFDISTSSISREKELDCKDFEKYLECFTRLIREVR